MIDKLDAALRFHQQALDLRARRQEVLSANIANAGSAMTAQSQRLNVTASNLANADSVAGPDGQPYRAKQVVFESAADGDRAIGGVRVSQVVEDPSPLRRVYDPKNPAAGADG